MFWLSGYPLACPPMPPMLPSATAVAGVTLRSADRGRSEAFYREVAGLQEIGSGELGWEGAPLVRVVEDGVAGGHAPRAATGLFHTALRYSDRAALGRALERVVRAGLLTGASDHGVSEALYLDDPDGNGVELYVDRPREAWPPPARGREGGHVHGAARPREPAGSRAVRANRTAR